MENRDSARMGKAVEHLVAATCILVSELELNVSTSLVDDEGVDLVFHRRNDPTTLAVQVKSRSMNARTIAEKDRFLANVGASTFRARRDLYMMFVLVDTRAGSFDPVWLVPSVEFERISKPNEKGRLRFSASTKAGSTDQWSEFRTTRASLAADIVGVLNELAK